MSGLSDAIVYDARKHEVHAVTIYKSNQAEVSLTARLSLKWWKNNRSNSKIKRKIVLNLKAGQNVIDIRHLPTNIQHDSILVNCIGQADVVKVIYRESPTFAYFF